MTAGLGVGVGLNRCVERHVPQGLVRDSQGLILGTAGGAGCGAWVRPPGRLTCNLRELESVSAFRR